MKRTLLFGGLLAMTVSCGPVTPQQADNVKSWAESGPYFGQTAPWGEAEIFMPGLVTTHGRNGNICFRRNDGSWTHPINMGPAINSSGNEMRSFVAHDGSAYFFGTTREAAVPKGEVFVSEAALRYGDNDVYWIDGSIIDELRASVSTTTCASEIIRRALLAELHEQKGEIEEAIAACEQAIALNPDFRDAPALMDRLGSNRRTDHGAT